MSDVQVSQAAREAAATLLTGGQVAGGDGGTYWLKSPTIYEAEKAFARFEQDIIARLATRPAPVGEPVAVIGKDYALHWASADTLSAIVARTGIKVGTPLYTRPALDVDGLAEKVAAALRRVASWDGTPIVSDAQLTDVEVDALATAALAAIKDATDASA